MLCTFKHPHLTQSEDLVLSLQQHHQVAAVHCTVAGEDPSLAVPHRTSEGGTHVEGGECGGLHLWADVSRTYPDV